MDELAISRWSGTVQRLFSRQEGCVATSLFSTYRAGENRVTASILAVLRALLSFPLSPIYMGYETSNPC